MPEIIEYRVRPVTRYMVTRYYEDASQRMAGCSSLGEFENIGAADRVALALQQTEPGSTYATVAERREPLATVHAFTQEEADALMAQVVKEG